MSWSGVMGLILVIISAALMLGVGLLRRKSPAAFREIPGFARLRQAIGRAVENGSRLHFSLGRASLATPQSASALAGLSMLRRLADLTLASDKPPVATSGEATIAILSQDTLRTAIQTAAGGDYDPTTGRLTGLTSFSYAAGSLPVMHDESVSANVIMGNFGIEVGLLTDMAERLDSFTLAASDNLTAQAVLYASAQEPLIGEELFAAGAYVDAGVMHSVSLSVQDILRGMLIAAILVGALLKVFGIL